MKIAIGAQPLADARVSAPLLFLLTVLLGLQPLSTDLYLPSLPQLAADLGVSAAAAQSTLSVFIAGFALMQLVVGPLADRFGRRPVVLGGALAYLAASVLGTFAPTLGWLVFARLGQSLGLCCTVLCARAIVRDLYDPEAGARVLAHALGWMTLITLLGPIVGGGLSTLFGWRSAFATLSLVGAVLVATAFAWLPESNRHRNPRALAPRALASTYLEILRSRDFRAFALTGTGSYCALFSFISGSSFVLIRVLGLTPTQYGVAFGVVTLGFLPGTLLTRRVQPVLGIRRTAMLGGAVACAASLTMAALAFAGVQTVWAVVVPMFAMLFSHGLLQPTSQVGAIAAFPHAAGAAAALLGFLMHVAAALVGSWIGASLDGTTRPLAATIGAIGTATAFAAFVLLRGPAAVAAEPADAQRR